MSSTIALLLIGVSVLFILGIKFLSSPKTARKGNLVAAAGMLVGLLILSADWSSARSGRIRSR
jgi:NAD(P) transhydrogenase subunit beta